MMLIDGGEIICKSRDKLRIGEADSEMSTTAKTKMNLKKKNEERTFEDVTWSWSGYEVKAFDLTHPTVGFLTHF
jgi:hypothetical protein